MSCILAAVSRVENRLPPSPWDPWEAEAFIVTAWRRLAKASRQNGSCARTVTNVSVSTLPLSAIDATLAVSGHMCKGALVENDSECASTSFGSSSPPSDNSDQSSSECFSSDDEDVEEVFSSVPPPPVGSTAGDARTRARLSPLLAKTLRHSATSWGLQLRADGYASVSGVLSLPPFADQGFTIREVEHVVQWERQESKKQRFSLRHSSIHGLEIRANQGHSDNAVDERLLARPIPSTDLPATLVHGTYSKHMSQIFKEGLRPMARHHIHLFLEDGGVGRKDAEVLVYVDVAKALAVGIEFLRSENRVLLSTGGPAGAIPPACFAKVVQSKSGVLIHENIVAPTTSRYVPPHQRPGFAGFQASTASRLRKGEEKRGDTHGAQRRSGRFSFNRAAN